MPEPLGIYIHIPFCKKRCAYCDFFSTFYDFELVKTYISALLKETKKWGGILARPVNSLYIGGGTPSLLKSHIKTVINGVKDSFELTKDCEITVEANPESMTEEFLSAALSAGANRLSLGVQSFKDDELKMLGRSHSALQARNAYYLARSMGFKNISLDLMICLPNSNLNTLKFTLDSFMRLSPAHISAYMLKVEDNTVFSKQKIRELEEEEQVEQYMFVCEYLKNHGYIHYEISNFSKPHYESVHNSKYWNCEEYLGIGPSAYSFIDGRRFFYPNNYKKFLTDPETFFDGNGGTLEEKVMLGLRTNRGADISSYCEKNDPRLLKFEQEGLLKNDYPFVYLTDKGMLLSNRIITELIY